MSATHQHAEHAHERDEMGDDVHSLSGGKRRWETAAAAASPFHSIGTATPPVATPPAAGLAASSAFSPMSSQEPVAAVAGARSSDSDSGSIVADQASQSAQQAVDVNVEDVHRDIKRARTEDDDAASGRLIVSGEAALAIHSASSATAAAAVDQDDEIVAPHGGIMDGGDGDDSAGGALQSPTLRTEKESAAAAAAAGPPLVDANAAHVQSSGRDSNSNSKRNSSSSVSAVAAAVAAASLAPVVEPAAGAASLLELFGSASARPALPVSVAALDGHAAELMLALHQQVGGNGADTDSSDDEADDQAADDLPGLESASDWESESEAEWEHDCESVDTDAMTDVDE